MTFRIDSPFFRSLLKVNSSQHSHVGFRLFFSPTHLYIPLLLERWHYGEQLTLPESGAGSSFSFPSDLEEGHPTSADLPSSTFTLFEQMAPPPPFFLGADFFSRTGLSFTLQSGYDPLRRCFLRRHIFLTPRDTLHAPFFFLPRLGEMI